MMVTAEQRLLMRLLATIAVLLSLVVAGLATGVVSFAPEPVIWGHFPPPAPGDFSPHPTLRGEASRTRALVMAGEDASHEAIMELVADHGGRVVAVLPDLKLYLVGVEDRGDHRQIDRLVETLQGSPLIESAAPDVLLSVN